MQTIEETETDSAVEMQAMAYHSDVEQGQTIAYDNPRAILALEPLLDDQAQTYTPDFVATAPRKALKRLQA